MSKPERQLRLVQVGCILLVAFCIFVRHIGSHESHYAISFGQWLVIVSAIWSAVGGFTLQRRITRLELDLNDGRQDQRHLADGGLGTLCGSKPRQQLDIWS